MDVFTMVVLACVAGEPKCLTARISEMGFTSAAACEARIDPVTDRMTKELGQRPELKGRAVTYDVTCMDRVQLNAFTGGVTSDT